MNVSQVAQSPRKVDIAITGRCNLDCKYCFYADEMTALHDLPTDRWLSLFEELAHLGVMEVCLTGGEVFTRKDLFTLIDSIIANRMRYRILTNGTLITEKLLAQFDVGKRRLRLDSIQVSVDGSRAEIHDKTRPNSFERAIRGLRLLVKNNFPVTVRVTINSHNVDDLENIAQLLLDDIGIPSFGTNEVYPCGPIYRTEEQIMLSSAQRTKAMQVLTALSERYNGRISAQAGPLALARHSQIIEDSLAVGEIGIPGRGHLVGCGCPFSTISVLHDGTIVPCHILHMFHLGTIGTDEIQQVWLDNETENRLRTRRAVPLSSLDTCADCPYQGFCTGGCPGIAVAMTGDLNGRDPMSCYRIYKGEDNALTPDEFTSFSVENNDETRSI